MSTSKFGHHLTAFLIAATTCAAQAQSSEGDGPLRFVGSVGFGWGGDTLVNGIYLNSGNSFSIRAGSGPEVMAGVEYQITPKWSGRATVGWQEHATAAGDGEFNFQRYPVEIVALYDVVPSWRIGAGLHKSLSPKLSSSGSVKSYGSRTYEGSTGFALVGQYFLNPGWVTNNKLRAGAEVRYVKEDFTEKNSGRTYNGDHFSVALVLAY